jgi:hemerythrin superfamily protein
MAQDRTRPDGGDDAIALLVGQHKQIEQLFAETLQRSGDERADAFFKLRRLLAVHETAEEQFVHPRARWVLGAGDPIANARLGEETEAKRALVELEKLDVSSEEFVAGLRQLQDDVLAHARAEETEEFVHLADVLDDKQLKRMKHLIQAAEKLAPTRPHPDLALGGENTFGGAFVTLLDRVRDLFSRSSADDSTSPREG